ncbi:hypothetical protein OFO93_33965, partial [Escherichia coli]|nr:hypothetical protein [Escherichia coli]
ANTPRTMPNHGIRLVFFSDLHFLSPLQQPIFHLLIDNHLICSHYNKVIYPFPIQLCHKAERKAGAK